MNKLNNITSRLLLLIVILLPITFSGNTPVFSDVNYGYQFSSEFLPNNERVDYVVKALNQDFDGKATFTIKRITQMDMNMLLMRYDSTEGENSESWEVKVFEEDLKPFSFDQTRTEGENTSNITGSFSGRDITLTARYTNEDAREIILSKGTKFYLSMMLPYLPRSLDFESNVYFTFSMLNISEGNFITPILLVKEKEIIEVPAGMYDCWKVSVKIGPDQHTAWYSMKEPHYLVKYKYPDKELLMERHY